MEKITRLDVDKIGEHDLSSLDIEVFDIPQSRVEELSTSSPGSLGVLKKFNIMHTKAGLLYIKAGIHRKAYFSIQQPIAEAIAADLGILLGFDVVTQHLWVIDAESFGVTFPSSGIKSEDDFERILAKTGKVLVSVSRSFRQGSDEFRSCDSLLPSQKGKELYEELCDLGDTRQAIDQMIVFDYIIGNTDRHKKNFGFIDKGNSRADLSFSPLFDHGLSFASENSDEDIYEYGEELLTYEGGKPFTTSLLAALDYIDKDNLEVTNLSVTTDEQVTATIERYRPLLGDVRFEFINTFILRRYRHVKKILSKAQK